MYRVLTQGSLKLSFTAGQLRICEYGSASSATTTTTTTTFAFSPWNPVLVLHQRRYFRLWKGTHALTQRTTVAVGVQQHFHNVDLLLQHSNAGLSFRA